MADGRSSLYDNGEVAQQGDVAAAAVSQRTNALDLAAAAREIDTLRSINAHLVRQIEVLKQREAQALRLADRDGLTGLYNRRRMLELLDTSIADAARHDHRVGLLFIDLDGFKGVNDDFEHAAGDKLLMTVASRIAARARTADFVCRYGGDEFVVILPRVAGAAAVARIADSIQARLTVPYRIDGIELHMTAAIGIAIYPDQAEMGADLLNLADESMYRAKAQAAGGGMRRNRSVAPSRRRDDKSRKGSGA